MLTPTQIADEIEVQVRPIFPGEECYREKCPENFTRPCTLLVEGDCEIDPNKGSCLVGLQPTYTLTTFVEVDEYHNSHYADLHSRQRRLLALFMPGYLLVEEAPGKRARAPKVVKLTTGGGYDYDTVTVIFEYAVDRREFLAPETAPPAGEIRVRPDIKNKE